MPDILEALDVFHLVLVYHLHLVARASVWCHETKREKLLIQLLLYEQFLS